MNINDCIKIENNIKDIHIINQKIEKYKNADKNIHICYEENNYENEIKFYLEIFKYICKDDKLNIYLKQKEIETENINLKEKIDYLHTINYLSKFNLSNNSFAFLSRVNEKWSLDTPGQDSDNTISSPFLWEFSSTSVNQIFKIIKNEDGKTFSIKNKLSGNFLGMEEKNKEWKIVLREKGGNHQKFKLILVENNYFLIQNENGQFIDLINNIATDGGEIRPNIKTNSLGQQWKLFVLKN